MATVVTTAGRAVAVNRLRGTGTEPLYVGWGTGAGTATTTATGLFTETASDLSATAGTRITGSSSSYSTNVTGDTYRVTATYTASGSGTVTNAGLHDAATIGAGNLYMYGDFTGVGLAANDAIAFTFDVVYG
ncbi:MAG: hypothetical protein IPK85_02185 [Gemmatimonadetes bacterium]|nr:hypothetical protein [Gemmatimonadota bacterium]